MERPPKLDKIDLAILAELQRNGRATNAALAERVGLSPSPCLQRVRRLEAAGYIAGYGAQIALGRLRDSLTVFTEVTLSNHRREDFVKFESGIRRYEHLLECHLVSGGYDYLLKFVTRSVDHYQSIMEDVVDRSIGVEKYFSYIVIKTLLQRPGVPVAALLGEDER
jgi:DNA-binding Lrp family transcriptional regulator